MIYDITFNDSFEQGPLPTFKHYRHTKFYGVAVNVHDQRDKVYVAGRKWVKFDDLTDYQKSQLKSRNLIN